MIKRRKAPSWRSLTHSLRVAACRDAGLQMALVWNNAILLDQATKRARSLAHSLTAERR